MHVRVDNGDSRGVRLVAAPQVVPDERICHGYPRAPRRELPQIAGRTRSGHSTPAVPRFLIFYITHARGNPQDPALTRWQLSRNQPRRPAVGPPRLGPRPAPSPRTPGPAGFPPHPAVSVRVRQPAPKARPSGRLRGRRPRLGTHPLRPDGSPTDGTWSPARRTSRGPRFGSLDPSGLLRPRLMCAVNHCAHGEIVLGGA